MQACQLSMIEAATNVVAGLLLALLLQLLLSELLDLRLSIGDNVAITAVFSIVSLVRAYTLRRLYNALKGRKASRSFIA